MDYKQIKELIRIVNNSDIGEIAITNGDFKLRVTHKDYKKGAVVQSRVVAPIPQLPPVSAPTSVNQEASNTPAKPIAKREEKTDEGNFTEIKSPMIGTFYRSSSPDKEPYVKVGDHINKGDVLCIIEAMKLFNEIEAEVSGKIVKVLPENTSPVEYDQPLFLIDPS